MFVMMCAPSKLTCVSTFSITHGQAHSDWKTVFLQLLFLLVYT